MTTIRTRGPSLYSVFTAFVYAFIISAVFMAYALAQTLVKFSITETLVPWYIVAVSYATTIAMYSAISKPVFLITKNAAVIFFITTLSILLCGMINPGAIKMQFAMLLWLSAYSLFSPILLCVFMHLLCRHSNLDSVLENHETKGVENRCIDTRASSDVKAKSEKEFVGKNYDRYYRE